MIDEGKFFNIKALTATIGVDSGLISRTIRLTLLSPKIIHKLLSGELDLSWDSCRRSLVPRLVGWNRKRCFTINSEITIPHASS